MNWRFIPYSKFDGAMNMAIDSYLLENTARSGPVLRLYGFDPSCLTLGLNQKFAAETARQIQEKGFEVIRRPSGGRAVLHHKDLTYAFVASEKGYAESGVLEHSVSAAYRQICEGLRFAFELLGLPTEMGSADVAYRHLSDCFLATTNADLHYKGRKLAGSAQLRRRNAVLQHGSIPLDQDQELMPELLGGAGSTKRESEERHTNLFEAIGRELNFAELNQSMKKGFERAFAVEFDEDELSAEELREASAIKSQFSFALESGVPGRISSS